MDAKSKADFINSVASGNVIPCPKCGTSNNPDRKFCFSCGTEFSSSQEKESDTVAFASVEEAEAPAENFTYVEPNNAFAQGLPEWSLEPPQVMIRRH